MLGLSGSILAYLLALLMAVTPVTSEAGLATGEITLRDVVVTLNGETYDLGVDGRLAYMTDGESADLEFALDHGGEKLFPARAHFDENSLTAMLDGMSKSYAVDLSEALGDAGAMDAETADAFQKIQKLQESYQKLITLTMAGGEEALEAEFAGLEAQFDRGEPVDSELEFDDGEKLATKCWTYTLTKDDLANVMEAMLSGDGEFATALKDYYDAVADLSGEALPEGGLVQMFREQGDMDVSIDVTEHVNEAEALEYAELLMHFTADGESVDAPVYIMKRGDTQTVDTYLDTADTSFGLSAEMTENEDGKHVLADFSVQHIEVETTDALEDYEPVARTDEAPEAEEAPEANEAPEAEAENDLADLEGEDSVIGGADAPTEIYATSSIAATPIMDGHFEASETAADENGASTFDVVYRITGYEGDEVMTFTIACGGTETKSENSQTDEIDFTFSVDMPGTSVKLTGTVDASFGNALEIAAPAAATVDPLNGEQEEINALNAEALGILMEDSGKLMQIDGISRLAGAFTALESQIEEGGAIESGETSDVEITPSEYVAVSSIEEANAVFGAELPFGDTFAGAPLTSADVAEGSAYLIYNIEDDYSAGGFITVYKSDDSEARYRMDENGALAADEGDMFYLVGDEENGYWQASWEQGDLHIDLNLMNGVDFDTLNAYIQEIYAK